MVSNQSVRYFNRSRSVFIIRLLAALLIFMFLILTFSGCAALGKLGDKPVITDIYGQFFPGRAIELSGSHFGQFESQKSQVKIDGKESAIISWSEHSIIVLVPPLRVSGQLAVEISNPPHFHKLETEAYFFQYRTKEIATTDISPDKDTVLETDEFTIIIPAGSLREEKTIHVRRLSRPTGVLPVGSAAGGAEKGEHFREVLEEYEIVDEHGEHILFDQDILFGVAIDLQDKDELSQYGLQYFNDVLGIWARAQTIYDPSDGKLYAITSHFSFWQKFKDHMKKQAVQKAGEAFESVQRKVAYPFKITKKATDYVVDKIVDLEIDTYINDQLRENFIGVLGEAVIVYYRESDAKKDRNIPDIANQAAAAFDHAYQEYARTMGQDKIPSVYTFRKKGSSLKDYWLGGNRPSSPYSDTSEYQVIADPLQVYIDPGYNLKGANYSIVSGNTTIPSQYPDNDLETTCAHELFHVIQHHQLGSRMLYMANGLKDAAGSFSSDQEVFSYLANNKWFFEATAEYASLFIGTGLGLEHLHNNIEATQTYYAFTGVDGGQEYAMSAFIDYIVTDRMLQTESRPQAFRIFWEEVISGYSMLNSINTSLNSYVQTNLGTSATELYGEFWQDILLWANMPLIPVADNAAKTSKVNGITDFASLQKTRDLVIKPEGCGIYRANVNDTTMKDMMDETTLQCSIWFKPSNKKLEGLAYKLNGLASADRFAESVEPAGAVSSGQSKIPEAFFPFKPGDAFAIAAFYQSYAGSQVYNKMALKFSAVTWENKKEITKKMKNTTLSFADKLEFKADLPPLTNNRSQYTADVIINNDEDFSYKDIKIESNKTFSVDPPMYKDSNMPPAMADVDIIIYLDGEIVHHYQSVPAEDEALMIDIALADGQLEAGSAASFQASGIPGNISVSEFVWKIETSPKDLFPAEQITSDTEIQFDFVQAGTLSLTVDVYGEKDGSETLLASATRMFTIEDPKTTSTSGQVNYSIEGKWKAYARSWGSGGGIDDLGPQTNNYTLSIGNGSFTFTVIAPSGESWDFIGYVREFTWATGEPGYELVLDSGDKNLDNFQKNDLKNNQNLEALYVELFNDGQSLSLGAGDDLLFNRTD